MRVLHRDKNATEHVKIMGVARYHVDWYLLLPLGSQDLTGELPE